MNTDTPDILKKIVETEQNDLITRKSELPIDELEDRILSGERPYPLNFAGTLMGDDIRVIAEIKRATPSKGVLRDQINPLDLANTYAQNGAAAVSILTNKPFFKGSLEDIELVRGTLDQFKIPILRKDFIFDPYQICEARAFWADAILLIVSMLPSAQIKDLMDVAMHYWMQCLVEVHNEKELDIAINAGADIIGINNRNLRTFDTDLSVTEYLCSQIPDGIIVVSESGIQTPDDVKRVKDAGAHAILVGEALIKSDNPGDKLRELV